MDQTRFKQVSVNMRAHRSTRPTWELISRGKSSGHFRDHTCDYNVDINETFVTSSEDNETAELLLLLSRMK